ncbi:MAG: GIY-YIG nuclease family protein [Burkholderiales bacterium]|nr:GIY-YIG nuclease family protein [Burkholderiales bacterium]
MNLKDLKKIKIPDKPGVYFFLKNKPASTRQDGGILYIGKATSLKDRVRSYFGKDPEEKQAFYGAGLIESRGPLIVKMIKDADEVKWQETDSVLEALILEASLIKKYQPKYNTKEKSDRSFNYVCITKEKKIAIIRGRNIKKMVFDKIYGPFPNNSQLREALRIIRKIFPYFEDRKNTKGKDEFYKQIKLVPENLIENKNNIKNIKLLFEGKKKKIFLNLKKEMNSFAKKRAFEKAGEVKRQIFALQHINDVALIKNNINDFTGKKIFDSGFLIGNPARVSSNFSSLRPSPEYRGGTLGKLKIKRNSCRIEAYDIAHMGGKNIVGVMVVLVDGEIEKSEYKKFKIKSQNNTLARRGGNDIGALEEVLERRFKHREWQYPDVVIMDGGIAQINLAKRILSKIDENIKIVSVLKDEKHKAKAILGDKTIGLKYKKEILLANSEAHRFAINYHKKLRNKNFIK